MLSTAIVAVGIEDRIAQHLASKGHAIETSASNAAGLLERMRQAPVEALILGSQSGLNGSFVAHMRASRLNVPAIGILDGPRGKKWSHECAHFLDCGGDDVIVGPPDVSDVALSVRKVCRSRAQPEQIAQFVCPGTSLVVNLSKRRISLNGKPFSPTGCEAKILFCLATHSKAMSRADIANELHGEEVYLASIDVLICHLRKRLGDAAQLLETVRGVGYQLVGQVH